ncbi:cold shock domain-containing protein [Streptomyces sp. SID4917]|nr:cold shock domain-containing protein [Streptomyces sp. SID4917]SCF70180.1 Cold shock protein, CspA family [Streptomyces sp. MnatMP-M17]
MPTGVVKWYDPDKEIGVITSDGADLELRVQRRAVRHGSELRSGERVHFDIWFDASGRWANNIQRLGPAPAEHDRDGTELLGTDRADIERTRSGRPDLRSVSMPVRRP